MVDHDQRFKVLLQTFFRDFIDLFFHDWVGRFDWSTVEWLEQEAFLDPPRGWRRELDLVAKLRLLQPVQTTVRDGETFLILIHVEVDSSEGVAKIPSSMFGYYAWLRAKHQLPVFPIGVYLRVGLEGTGWSVHRELLWEQSLLEFRFPYIGLPGLDAKAYLNGENLLGVALAALMRVSDEDKARLKADAMQRLATSNVDAARRFLLCECVEAYLPLEGTSMGEYDQLLMSEKYEEARMVGQTSFERGIEKGYEKGFEEARRVAQTSYERGVEKGQLALLQRQLQRRFGLLTEEIQRRLEALAAEKLEELSERLLDASSLAELGLTGDVPPQAS